MKSMTKTWSLSDITSLDSHHLCLRGWEAKKAFFEFLRCFYYLSQWPDKTATILPCHLWFPKMMPEEWLQKFDTDDASLPDLRSASDWLVEANFHPIRSTTQIWVVTCHQCGISALVSQTSFSRENRGGITKCPLSAHGVTCAAKSFQ